MIGKVSSAPQFMPDVVDLREVTRLLYSNASDGELVVAEMTDEGARCDSFVCWLSCIDIATDRRP